jgi:hypothetical protein
VKISYPSHRAAILQDMKHRATNAKFASANSKAIRPAADSRRGSEKAAATAKERASRARGEIAAFKSRG